MNKNSNMHKYLCFFIKFNLVFNHLDVKNRNLFVRFDNEFKICSFIVLRKSSFMASD